MHILLYFRYSINFCALLTNSIKLGKASLNKPDILNVTSTLGLSNKFAGIISKDDSTSSWSKEKFLFFLNRLSFLKLSF